MYPNAFGFICCVWIFWIGQLWTKLTLDVTSAFSSVYSFCVDLSMRLCSVRVLFGLLS